MVYDISKYNTFQNIERWFSELREHAEYNIAVLLVGNKSDLKSSRAVSSEEAASYAKKHGIILIGLRFYIGIGFIETSALDSSNVEKAFINVINDIYR